MMEGKLIKTDGGFFMLFDKNKNWIGVTGDSDGKKLKLSFKNCQSIENGYDLDELALSYVGDHLLKGTDEYHNSQVDFKEGAKAILEILGNKKFSEEALFDSIMLGVAYEYFGINGKTIHRTKKR